MTATTHMSTPMTGSSPAALLLSLLGGQTGGAQAAAGAQGVGNGAFAALLQSLAGGTGSEAQAQAGKTGGQTPAPTLGALLSLYKSAPEGEETGKDAQGGDPLKALFAALQNAGVDLDKLSLPADLAAQAQPGDMTGTTESGDAVTGLLDNGSTGEDQAADVPQDPFLALIGLLAAQMPAENQPANQPGEADTASAQAKAVPVPPAGQAVGTGDPSTDPLLHPDGKTRQSVENFLSSLSPEDRARIADALRQLQTAQNGTTTPQAEEAAKAAPQVVAQADTARPGGKANAGPAESGPPPAKAAAQPQVQTPAQAQAQAQPETGAHQQAQTAPAQQATGQAEAQARASAPGSTDADTTARTISQTLPEHLSRDTSVQVRQGHPTNGGTGGHQLLSAGTSASVMAASQDAATAASAQDQAASGAQQPPKAQGLKTAGAGSTDTLFGLKSGDAAADPLKTGAFSDTLGQVSQPGSVDQLESSVAKIARAPLTYQAAPSQVAMHLSRAAETGGNRFVIQLSPASLGDVDVDLKVGKDGTVHAMLHVQKPETLQMLQRDSGILHQALQDAGLKPDSGSLSFSLRQDGGQFAGQNGSQGGGHAHGGGLPDMDTSIADMAAQPARRSHAGQLDVTI